MEYRRILLDGYPTLVTCEGIELVAADGRRVDSEHAIHLAP
ncbi:MAG: FAA hydrolase family protein, partial [Actinomycetota bacterium]|nr:FAA hydrolase family protein [Actinomycetota bacterium]